MLANRQIPQQDSEPNGWQYSTSNGQAITQPLQRTVDVSNDRVNNTAAKGQAQANRDHPRQSPWQCPSNEVTFDAFVVEFLNLGIDPVCEERVGETSQDIRVNHQRGNWNTQRGDGLVRIHPGTNRERNGQQGTGVSINLRCTTKGPNTQNGQLHRSPDRQASLHIAHDQTSKEAGEHRCTH